MPNDDLSDSVDDTLIRSRIPLNFTEICRRTNLSERSIRRQIAQGNFGVEELDILNRKVKYYYKSNEDKDVKETKIKEEE